MCGIAGWYFPGSDESPANGERRMQRMLAALAHRGPDDLGCTLLRGAALGMTRLAIVGIANGTQPLASEDGALILVGNGEIYNAPELRAELRGRGHHLAGDSDIEVALHLFEESGVESFRRLRGMFALAFLDLRAGRLCLVRDRLGIKPLFYTEVDGGVLFASEPRALRAGRELTGAADLDVDPSALREFLRFGYLPAPLAIERGVRRLAPGEYAICAAGSLDVARWWDWPAPDEAAAARPFHAHVEELEALLRSSVHEHTMGDVPAGAFLSGGLDSGTLVALLAEATPRRVPVFTIAFDDPDLDESALAERTARAFGCEHHLEVIPSVSMGEVDALLEAYGEPFADVSLLPTAWVARLARRHVKFVLAGDGGDELFAGYAWLARELRMRRLPQPLLTLLGRCAPLLGPAQQSLRADLLGKALRAVGDLAVGPTASFLRRRSLSPPHLAELLLHRRLIETRPARRTRQEEFASASAGGVLDTLLALDRRFYLANDILEKVDRASMLHSLEARVPYLDHRIVEFAARLPLAVHLGADGRGKALLRAIASRLLPREVTGGRKRGFGIPVDRWLREGLFEEARARLLDREFRRAELVRTEAVESLLYEHRTGLANHGHRLWALLSLAAWHRAKQSASQPLPAVSRRVDCSPAASEARNPLPTRGEAVAAGS